MSKEIPSYFSIITAPVRYATNINANEKLLFSDITALTGIGGYCFASNHYFAKIFNVTPQAISKWIKHLKDGGYISIKYKYKDDTKEIISRLISVNLIYSTPENNDSEVSTTDYRVSTTDYRGINNGLKGYQQRVKGNSIKSNNNKSNNKRKEVSDKEFKNTKTTSNLNNTYSDEFEKFWKYYERNGNKKKSYSLWNRLSEKQKSEIREKLPLYVKHTNINGVYPSRKNAEVYLNPKNEHWNDRVIIVEDKNNINQKTKTDNFRAIFEAGNKQW